MKIVSLRAENIKKLVAVEITPAGNLVQITGKNGQGKSSVLDAIWWALAGLGNVQAVPIRKGEAEARIRLDLGEIKVVRTFRQKEGREFTSTITVENGEGARFPSPQKMLDGLLGELTFDPLAFRRMDGRAQFDALRRFVPGVDFDAIEKANRVDFQARTDVNRRAKEARTRGEAIQLPPTDMPVWVDEAGLVADLEAAGQTNATIERRRAAREAVRREVEASAVKGRECRSRAAELRREADRFDGLAGEHERAAADQQRRLDDAEALPEPVDTADLTARIRSARESNARLDQIERDSAERARLLDSAKALEADAAVLTAAMEKRSAEKLAAIAAAKMPVPGLEFGDGEILLAGVPFAQASDAEQLRASIAIAMASNPKLRVIRVRDGSLLDEDAMRIVAEMADAADYQVWVERVDSSGKVGIVLEDGHVRAPVPLLEATE